MNTNALDLLYMVCGLGGLGLVAWIGPIFLVTNLAERRGMRSGWLTFLTFLFPISALISVPILLFMQPNMEGLRKYAERDWNKAMIAKARKVDLDKIHWKEDLDKIQITEGDIANMANLKPWIKGVVIYVVLTILWLVGYMYLSVNKP